MSDCLVDGKPASTVPVDVRGLQYGDGVFETLAVRNGMPEYLGLHLQRLDAGCKRLKMDFDNWLALQADIERLAAAQRDSVIKITLTRAAEGRGYRIRPGQAIIRVVSCQPWPSGMTALAESGVRVRVCDLRLASQPGLAGIKHLNRLEQVLARAEWQDECQEGLMLDYGGNLIEGCSSNLFLVQGGRLKTPGLETCGVAGVMRSVIIHLARKTGVACSVGNIERKKLESCTELFLCNSLIGIWPVTAIDGLRSLEVGPLTRSLQTALADFSDSDCGQWQAK